MPLGAVDWNDLGARGELGFGGPSTAVIRSHEESLSQRSDDDLCHRLIESNDPGELFLLI